MQASRLAGRLLRALLLGLALHLACATKQQVRGCRRFS